jgi:hypothetical protein
LLKAIGKGEEVQVFKGRQAAKQLGRQASDGEKLIHHGPHAEGWSPHYQSKGFGGHIFYSTAAALSLSTYTEGRGAFAETLGAAVDLFNPLGVLKDAADITSEFTDPASLVPFDDPNTAPPENNSQAAPSPPQP